MANKATKQKEGKAQAIKAIAAINTPTKEQVAGYNTALTSALKKVEGATQKILATVELNMQLANSGKFSPLGIVQSWKKSELSFALVSAVLAVKKDTGIFEMANVFALTGIPTTEKDGKHKHQQDKGSVSISECTAGYQSFGRGQSSKGKKFLASKGAAAKIASVKHVAEAVVKFAQQLGMLKQEK